MYFLFQTPQHLFLIPILQWGTHCTLLTNSKEKRSVFTFQNQNILSTTLQLQGHKGRCVHFGTCVKNFIFNASCESHRPAFMTLEPIRWHCKFCWELRNDEYNNNIKLIINTTTWRESLTNLAEINNFWWQIERGT